MKNHLSPEELYALEQKARRLRALEMRRLILAGVGAVRGLFRTHVKGFRHA